MKERKKRKKNKGQSVEKRTEVRKLRGSKYVSCLLRALTKR